MNLNHVHLAGPDVGALERFYVAWFGFRRVAEHGEGVFLRNDEGFLLALDPVAEAAQFPKWFHVGFCLGSADAVRDLHRRMTEAGVRIARELLEFDGEAAAFYAEDPAGTRVEVSWHASDA